MNWVIIASIIAILLLVCILYFWKNGGETEKPLQRGAGYVRMFSLCNYKGTVRYIAPGYYKISYFGNLAPIMSVDVPQGMVFTMVLTNGQVVNITRDVPCMRNIY